MGPAKNKHNSVNNIRLVLKELQRTSEQGGSTLEELADLCGVSTRNVYRYLKEIETMGFQLIRPSQLKSAKTHKGRYQLRIKVPEFFKMDTDLMMLIALYTQIEKQCYEHLNLIYEVFVRCFSIRNGIILPTSWKIK